MKKTASLLYKTCPITEAATVHDAKVKDILTPHQATLIKNHNNSDYFKCILLNSSVLEIFCFINYDIQIKCKGTFEVEIWLPSVGTVVNKIHTFTFTALEMALIMSAFDGYVLQNYKHFFIL